MEIRDGWAGVIFCVISALFALLLRTQNPVLLWVRTVLPLILVGLMFTFGELSDLNTKLAVRVSALNLIQESQDGGKSLGNEITVGNSSDRHDLVVRPFAAEGYVKASPADAQTYIAVSGASGDAFGRVLLTTYRGQPANGQPAMIVAYGQPSHQVFVGAVSLGDGDEVCFDKGCAHGWTFNDGFRNRLFAAAANQDKRSGTDKPASKPSFLRAPPIGNRRVYRLAEPERQGHQTAFFIGDDGGWDVLLLEDQAYVRRGCGDARRQCDLVKANWAKDCNANENMRMKEVPFCPEATVYRLDLSDNQLNSEVRLVKRRTVKLSTEGAVVSVMPSPPDTETAGNCKMPHVQLTRVSLAARQIQTYQTPDDVLRFADLGNPVLDAVGDGPLPSLSVERACTPGIEKFFQAEGTSTPVVLGDGKRAPMLRLSIVNTAIPWPLLGLAAVISLLVGIYSVDYWTRNPVDSAIVGLIQYLVALRLLIGVRGFFLDPSLSTAEVFGNVGAAIIGLPIIAVAVRPSLDWKARGVLALVSVFGFASLGLWLVKPDKVYGLIVVATAVALIWPKLPTDGLTTFFKAVGTKLIGLWRLPRRGLARLWSQTPDRLVRLEQDTPWAATWLIFLAFAVRGLATLVGVKERSGIALSTPYLVCILPGFAMYLAYFCNQGKAITWLAPGLFLGLLALAFPGAAYLTRDNGFAFVHIIPVLAMTAWLAWQAGPLPGRQGILHRWGRIAVLPVAVVAALLFLLWPAVSPLPNDTLAAYLNYAEAHSSSNDLRVLHQFFPDRVAMVGTRLAAENIQFWIDVKSFTSGPNGWWGGQYLSDTSLGQFKRQALHLSDNLSAVHIMGPFGRFGAVAMLAVIFVGTWTAAAASPPGKPTSWQRLAGQLMIWTVFTAAAYMVLANLGLVPFTGRNIYLLAAKSGSDLVEGMTLLLLARFWLERRSVQ